MSHVHVITLQYFYNTSERNNMIKKQSVFYIKMNYQIKQNLFAQQLTLYRQNHVHPHVLKTS